MEHLDCSSGTTYYTRVIKYEVLRVILRSSCFADSIDEAALECNLSIVS